MNRETSSLRQQIGVGSIRSRQMFAVVRTSGSRGRSGPLSVRFCEQSSWSKPEVGYAIGRHVGNAVVRNRLRRRLRALMVEWAPTLSAGAYVVGAAPGSSTLEFYELRVALGQALERATRRQPMTVPSRHPESVA